MLGRAVTSKTTPGGELVSGVVDNAAGDEQQRQHPAPKPALAPLSSLQWYRNPAESQTRDARFSWPSGCSSPYFLDRPFGQIGDQQVISVTVPSADAPSRHFVLWPGEELSASARHILYAQ